jgi:hypothetical protein
MSCVVILIQRKKAKRMDKMMKMFGMGAPNMADDEFIDELDPDDAVAIMDAIGILFV